MTPSEYGRSVAYRGMATRQLAEKTAAYAGAKTGPYSGSMAAHMRGEEKSLAGTAYTRDQHPVHYYLNPWVRGPLAELLLRWGRRTLAGSGKNYTGATLRHGVGAVGQALGSVSGVPGLSFPGAVVGNGAAAVLGGQDVMQAARDAHEAVNQPHHEAEKEERAEQALQERKRRAAAARQAREATQAKAAAVGPYDVQQASDVAYWDDVLAGIIRNRREKPWHYWLNPYVGGPLRELWARYARRVNAGTVENWPAAILNWPSLGLVPAVMGGRRKRIQARKIYQDYAAPYDDAEDAKLSQKAASAHLKVSRSAATKTAAIPSVDQLLDHPAAPWVALPAVGAGGGLLLNELGRIYAAIHGRKADEQQERLNRWTSAGIGAGLGLAIPLREKLQQLFRSSTTGGNLVAKAASASQYGRALALRAMADPFGG